MVIKCKTPLGIEDQTIEVYRWKESDVTRLQALAEAKALADEARALKVGATDPVIIRRKASAQLAQRYWTRMVYEAGNLAFLSPTKMDNVSSWLANWTTQRLGQAKAVREPLQNIKRLADGFVREQGVYLMLEKQRTLAQELRSLAKLRGATVTPEDMRRLLEEGMIPQRQATYRNTPEQEAALLSSYNAMEQDFINRGFTQDDLATLLSKAADVSAQWDQLTAVQLATGMKVDDMYNIGYMPRQLTPLGNLTPVAKDKSLGLGSPGGVPGVALAKSRETWKYLPEDNELVSSLLGLKEGQLDKLISQPVDFAIYLSKRVTPTQLELLVDSGVMSKLPMLTSEVSEQLIRTFKMPLGLTELFIADPIEATQQLTLKLRRGVEQSAMVKLITTEGIQRGWAYPQPLDPSWVKLSDIPEVAVSSGGMYVHPMVANQLRGILQAAKSPSEMNNVSRAWKAYTSWFSKEAIGNPLVAKVYLSNQFLSNMLSALGAGVPPHEYLASVVDMTKLAMRGLDAFDDTKVYRYDGLLPLTHRELVAKTSRMFSTEVLPGLNGRDALFKLEEFSPHFVAKQLHQLKSYSRDVPGYAEELAKIVGGKRDAVLMPTIRLASILDTAGHLAVTRNVLRGSKTQWADAVLKVRQTYPLFDDVGKIPEFISGVLPFSSWAIQNLPLQLADMRRHPSRWYAYSRIRTLWNSSMDSEEDPVLRGELGEREYSQYGMLLRRDPWTKGTVMMFTDQYDPKWGVVGLLANLLPPQREGVGRAKDQRIQQWTNQVISRSYLGGFYELATGVDPFTGTLRDDSEYNTNSRFAGIAMPAWVSALLSISPVLTSIDRLPMVSGTRPIVDSRTGEVLTAATQDWLGNQGKLAPQQLERVEATLQTLVSGVRYIDGINRMQWSEVELDRAINDLITRKRREQINLQSDLRSGTVKEGSAEYQRKLSAIHRMTDATIQLNWDLARIQQWGVANRVPSKQTLEEFRRRKLVVDELPLPGSDYIRRSLEQSLE